MSSVVNQNLTAVNQNLLTNNYLGLDAKYFQSQPKTKTQPRLTTAQLATLKTKNVAIGTPTADGVKAMTPFYTDWSVILDAKKELYCGSREFSLTLPDGSQRKYHILLKAPKDEFDACRRGIAWQLHMIKSCDTADANQQEQIFFAMPECRKCVVTVSRIGDFWKGWKEEVIPGYAISSSLSSTKFKRGQKNITVLLKGGVMRHYYVIVSVKLGEYHSKQVQVIQELFKWEGADIATVKKAEDTKTLCKVSPGITVMLLS